MQYLYYVGKKKYPFTSFSKSYIDFIWAQSKIIVSRIEKSLLKTYQLIMF